MHRRRTSSDAQAPPELARDIADEPEHLPAHPHHALPVQSSLQSPPGRRLRVHSTPTQYAPLAAHQRVLQPVKPMGVSVGASGSLPTDAPLSASLSVPSVYRSAYAPSPSSPSFRHPFSGTPAGTSPSSAQSDFLQGVGSLLPPASPRQSTTLQQEQQRRHSRIHSRNLSVFFPRPGTTPESIAEDGQEADSQQTTEAPVTLISTAHLTSPSVGTPTRSPLAGTPGGKLAPGFKFGSGRTVTDTPGSINSPMSPGTSSALDSAPLSPSSATTTSRRGHHHKHSLSHQFAFMDPAFTVQTDSNTLTVPSLETPATPLSPWQPISPFPLSAVGSEFQSASSSRKRVDSSATPAGTLSMHSPPPSQKTHALPSIAAFTALEFLVGAKLWITGQQSGSLSCTGLGYWIVFDALGVLLGAGSAAGFWTWLLGESNSSSGLQRPYGQDRVETTAFFAQTIYLLFAAVYVCKESVEHFLLSLGESHHHHPSDEYNWNDFGSPFPGVLLTACLGMVVFTASIYSNHARLLDAAGNTVPLPPVDAVIYHLSRIPIMNKTPLSFLSKRSISLREPWWANPFSLSPALFAAALLASLLFIEQHHHQAVDLVLSGLEAIFMFRIAWPAAVALGTVLLQTAPDRGTLDGRMEAFLRVMRELERHPQIVHLPPPHVWQLTPPSKLSGPSNSTALSSRAHEAQFIVSLEVHVRRELSDTDALALTRHAWEQCYGALNPRGAPKGAWGEKSGGGITVGIVRG
ncbi:hypothetical protein BKA62DRAFT_685349 [Auriculariales sp. MPI-PUGE-AT-0066]|nr:hypothetical protein BKA62DRAFT_685349 [Auriculariales sp. MPI-PUGE-AT-0066]